MAITWVGGQRGSFAGTTSAVLSVNFNIQDLGGTPQTVLPGDCVVISYSVGSTADRTLFIRAPDDTPYEDIGSELYSNDTFDTNLRAGLRIMPDPVETAFELSGTGNTADAGSYIVNVYRGVDPTNPQDVAAVTATGINSRIPNPPAITPVTAGAVIGVIGAGAGGTGGDYTAAYLSGFRAVNGVDTNDAMVGQGHVAWPGGTYDPAVFTGGGTSTTNDSWAAITFALRPEVTERRAQVSWAELEVPDAPRRGIVGWAELEVPTAPRRGIVGWAELEVPNAPRRGIVGWAELEVPTAPRRAIIGWAELEVPDAATTERRAVIGWAELETPNAPRRAIIGWAELETPNAPRRAIIGWAELETPNAPRRGVIGWAELEVPTAPRRAIIGWAELEAPNAPRQAIIGWAELEVPTAPRRAIISWAELELEDPPSPLRFAIISWAVLELPDPFAPLTPEQEREKLIRGAIYASGGKRATMREPRRKWGVWGGIKRWPFGRR